MQLILSFVGQNAVKSLELVLAVAGNYLARRQLTSVIGRDLSLEDLHAC